MKIILDKVSKRFNQDWLFRDLDYQFNLTKSYAITGPNGSGKTTLLKIISGMIPCTRGSVNYFMEQGMIDPDLVYQHLTFVAPYMEVPEDLTLREFFRFHFKLKPLSHGLLYQQVAEKAGIHHAIDKPIHSFSSGMKQRVKLALGFYSETKLLFLDEPTTNLDEAGFVWYKSEILKIKAQKMLIISSNQPREYDFCDAFIGLDRE